jgi:hypothetical protein
VIDTAQTPTVRVPAVHEMTDGDAARLHRLVRGARFLVSQPIRDDYRDLPLGTRQLTAQLPAGAAVVTVPSIRYGGLHPFQAALRVPGVDEEPPLVAYHDVRTLARAAGLPTATRLDAPSVRSIADASVAELRRREAELDVAASDLLVSPDADLMRTVNHPGNRVWLPLGARVLEALGVDAPVTDPQRPLLSGVIAPRVDWVLEAWGSSAAAHDAWTVGGADLAVGEVEEAHRDWYARTPRFVAAAVTRLAPLVSAWRAT